MKWIFLTLGVFLFLASFSTAAYTKQGDTNFVGSVCIGNVCLSAWPSGTGYQFDLKAFDTNFNVQWAGYDGNWTKDWNAVSVEWNKIVNAPYMLTIQNVDGNLRPSIDANRTAAIQQSMTNINPTVDANRQAAISSAMTNINPTVDANRLAAIASAMGAINPTIDKNAIYYSYLNIGSTYDGNWYKDWNANPLEWSKISSSTFPGGCGSGQAVQIVGSSLTCIDLNSTASIASNLILYFKNENSLVQDYNVMRANAIADGSYGYVKTFTASDQNLVAFRSRDLNVMSISQGVIDVHFHAQKTGGTKDLRLYSKLYKRDTAGNETLLATTENSGLITGLDSFDIHASIASTSMLVTDQLVLKFYSNVGGAGTNPDVNFIIDGYSNSNLSLPNVIDFNYLSSNFVPYTGALKNVNLNSKSISSIDDANANRLCFGSICVMDWNALNYLRGYLVTEGDIDSNAIAITQGPIDGNKTYLLQFLETWTDGNSWQNIFTQFTNDRNADIRSFTLIDQNLQKARVYTDTRFGTDRNADQRMFSVIDGNKTTDTNGVTAGYINNAGKYIIDLNSTKNIISDENVMAGAAGSTACVLLSGDQNYMKLGCGPAGTNFCITRVATDTNYTLGTC